MAVAVAAMNGALQEFVAAAKKAELHALAELQGALSPEARDLATRLLRHARGIIALGRDCGVD